MRIALLIVEFVALYFISRALTQTLFFFFYRISRNKSVAISVTTALLFPGTVIHELSHLFTAEVLGVPTGKLTLVPEGLSTKEDGEGEIRTGSVSIAKTGPFKRAAIGIAPVIVGLGALALLAYFLPTTWSAFLASTAPFFEKGETYALLLIIYLLFAVSNSLFASPEDLSGFWPLAITVALLAGAVWIAGFRLELTGKALEVGTGLANGLFQSLALVLALNVLILLLMHGLLILTRKRR